MPVSSTPPHIVPVPSWPHGESTAAPTQATVFTFQQKGARQREKDMPFPRALPGVVLMLCTHPISYILVTWSYFHTKTGNLMFILCSYVPHKSGECLCYYSIGGTVRKDPVSASNLLWGKVEKIMLLPLPFYARLGKPSWSYYRRNRRSSKSYHNLTLFGWWVRP